jgi:hypothetical protein
MQPFRVSRAIYRKSEAIQPNMDMLKRNGRRNVPEAAKSRLTRLRRKQLLLQLEMKRALPQQNAIPPAPDPLGP